MSEVAFLTANEVPFAEKVKTYPTLVEAMFNNDDNEDEQKTLLQNLITNLRESEDDEFDLEDADHNYLSDEDEEDDEE